MRWVFALLVLMEYPIGDACAQDLIVDTIKAQQPWLQKELYTFPKVVMPGKPTVSATINKDLCVDLLDADPDTTAPGQLFSQVWGDTGHWMPRLNAISWSTSRPFHNVFTVEFQAEGCGAYCEEFTTHCTYDLRSGERLKFDSLFTPPELDVVEDTIRGRWRRLVEAHIERIRDSVLVEGRPQDELDYFLEAFALYENCLKERVLERPYVADIDPQRGSLRVRLARCSGHVNRDADELDPMWIALPFPWLMPYLRKEMQALFMP